MIKSVLLLRGVLYIHPAYGELEFVRAYTYRGRRYKFRFGANGAAYEKTLDANDVQQLERVA